MYSENHVLGVCLRRQVSADKLSKIVELEHQIDVDICEASLESFRLRSLTRHCPYDSQSSPLRVVHRLGQGAKPPNAAASPSLLAASTVYRRRASTDRCRQQRHRLTTFDEDDVDCDEDDDYWQLTTTRFGQINYDKQDGDSD